uniref:Peptidase A1 domain-containing protein n=1 Tax=Alexandrium monilatum TaxID=311494 RepID=A0A7S4UVI8_9DINO
MAQAAPRRSAGSQPTERDGLGCSSRSLHCSSARMRRPWAAALALLLRAALLDAARLRQVLQHAHWDGGRGFVLELRNSGNVLYVADVAMGGQTLPAVYDTGSSQLFALSARCQGCPQGHATYSRGLSSSFAPGRRQMEVHRFGSGTLLAAPGFEAVQIGGGRSPYRAERVPFLEILETRMDVWDNDSPFSAIFGMGRPGPNGEQALLPVLGVRCFSICLERGTPAAPGWVSFGDSAGSLLRFTGPAKSIALVEASYWAGELTDMHMPGVLGADVCTPTCVAIVDTGTSVVTVPAQAAGLVARLSALVSSRCHDRGRLPSLRFQLGGVPLELPPEAYIVRSPGSTGCSHVFASMDATSPLGPVWVLGLPFLRRYYTVFDWSAGRIHVAPSDPACAAPTMSLLNRTQGHVHAGDGRRVPMEVDLDRVRLPPWASGGQVDLDIRTRVPGAVNAG